MKSSAARPSPLALVILGGIALVVAMAMARRPTSPSIGTANEARIEGEVHSAIGPLDRARVRVKGQDFWTTTDGLGRFTLPSGLGSRVTAGKEGYFIAGVDLDVSPLRLVLNPLPLRDNEQYEWVDPRADPKGSSNCANCHLEIYREWAGGGHAHGVSSRYFRDLYGTEAAVPSSNATWNLLAEYPGGSGVCASCHAPTASLEETLDLRKVRGVAELGVHCDYCHKVTEAAQGRVGLTHGRHGLTLLRPAQGQLFLGPLDDVDRGEDSFSPLYRQSTYCASCHEGVVFGVHAYSTFTEWQESPAARQGKQCQDCHMKPTGRMTNVAPGKGGIRRNPQTLANHVFFTGSQEEMLRQCLSLRTHAVREGESVRVQVELRTDAVGHRVPTGFADRHLLLVVDGTDQGGKSLAPLDGPRLPPAAGPDLVGHGGRLYAKLLHDDQHKSPAPFWKAEPRFEDNRLKPDSTDSSTYTFPREVTAIHVALIYRRFWHEVAQTKGWGNIETLVRDERIALEK